MFPSQTQLDLSETRTKGKNATTKLFSCLDVLCRLPVRLLWGKIALFCMKRLDDDWWVFWQLFDGIYVTKAVSISTITLRLLQIYENMKVCRACLWKHCLHMQQIRSKSIIKILHSWTPLIKSVDLMLAQNKSSEKLCYIERSWQEWHDVKRMTHSRVIAQYIPAASNRIGEVM